MINREFFWILAFVNLGGLVAVFSKGIIVYFGVPSGSSTNLTDSLANVDPVI